MKLRFRLDYHHIFMSTTVRLIRKFRWQHHPLQPARSRTSNLWLAVQRRQFNPTLIELRPNGC